MVPDCWPFDMIRPHNLQIHPYTLLFYRVWSEKWRFKIGGNLITSAPAIDEYGVLYVGSIWAQPNYLYAIYKSNGTKKWKYKVGQDIWSSPAIGDDGSIYFGSENDYG